MEDDNQIELPPSFIPLYTVPGGHRLREPLSHVRQRYELCEDMAQMLVEQARARQFALGVTELDVLERIGQALAVQDSPLRGEEARWVVRRLAELLSWPDPGPVA